MTYLDVKEVEELYSKWQGMYLETITKLGKTVTKWIK